MVEARIEAARQRNKTDKALWDRAHALSKCCDCRFWIGRCLKGKLNRIAWSQACELFMSKNDSDHVEIGMYFPMESQSVKETLVKRR